MARYLPKTLAKTLTCIACHSPSEHGLFWDPDGTMPWKDLYWALQEDPSLRFVREGHIRELMYLDLELPFVLEAGILKLSGENSSFEYPLDQTPPERLFYACPTRQFTVIRERGLRATRRRFVMLSTHKESAIKIARRRDSDPITMEVFARRAATAGIPIRRAGLELYLVESVPVEYILLPRLRDDVLAANTGAAKNKEKKAGAGSAPTPGSFSMDARHLEEIYRKKETGGKSEARGKSRRNWKQDARNERNKRNP